MQPLDVGCLIFLLICLVLFFVLALSRKSWRDDSVKFFKGEQKEHVLQEKIKIEKINASLTETYISSSTSSLLPGFFVFLIMFGVGAVAVVPIFDAANTFSSVSYSYVSNSTITNYVENSISTSFTMLDIFSKYSVFIVAFIGIVMFFFIRNIMTGDLL